jgi:hypothetical protein
MFFSFFRKEEIIKQKNEKLEETKPNETIEEKESNKTIEKKELKETIEEKELTNETIEKESNDETEKDYGICYIPTEEELNMYKHMETEEVFEATFQLKRKEPIDEEEER